MRGRSTSAAILWVFATAVARGHGHPAAIDDGSPDAWKYRLCGEMVGVAIQALKDRDLGRPGRVYADDGGPGPAIANAIVRKVYEEPGISSPKRAETFGRAYCNEALASQSPP
ncbi:MAG TPA: hypothetical protein PKD29_03250 [Rhodocyclaceae bacterium]|nr:hypothetical protein [Rhodocyclaceae bacterium]